MNLILIKKILPTIEIYLLLGIISIPHLLFAQGDDTGGGGTPISSGGRGILQNPINAGNIQQLLGLLMDIISVLILPFAIFFLVRTGFYFVTAGGDEGKIKQARTDFLYVVIGLAIVLGAQLIGSILQNTIGQLRP